MKRREKYIADIINDDYCKIRNSYLEGGIPSLLL